MTQRHLSDPRALRALAHPVRVAILEALDAAGPLTASDLADLVGESPSNCSWHLRKLAEFDLVEEAAPVPGRRRPWRATGSTIAISAGPKPAEGGAAAAAVERITLQRALDRLLDATGSMESTDGPVAHFARETLWLTPEEATSLRQSIDTLLSPYRDRCPEAGSRPNGTSLMEVVAWQAPMRIDGEIHER